MSTVFSRMQQMSGTAAQWTTANTVLLAGEIGYESDTNKFKIGDGTSAWTALAYKSTPGATGATGATGAAGATGPTGATGPQGPAGPTALVAGGDISGSYGTGGPTITLTVAQVGGKTASAVATAVTAVQAAVATPDASTLVLRDGNGATQVQRIETNGVNNDYAWVQKPGTASEVGMTTYNGFSMSMRTGAGYFFQFNDSKPATQDAQMIARQDRHLTLATDGSSATKGVRIAANGIQTSDLLQICDSNMAVLSHFDITGRLVLGSASAATDTLCVNGTASKTGGGSWATFSDLRMKDVGPSYLCGLHEICQLNPINYSYKPGNWVEADSAVKHVGFIAQEVAEVFPEAVTRTPPIGPEQIEYLQLINDPIIAAFVNAFKEVSARLETLEKGLRT